MQQFQRICRKSQYGNLHDSAITGSPDRNPKAQGKLSLYATLTACMKVNLSYMIVEF